MAESEQRARLAGRTPIRILLILVVLAVVAMASSALGIIGTGSAQTERSGSPLTGASWKVAKISSTGIPTGHRTGGPPFEWGTGFSTGARSAGGKSRRFCLFVTSDGPLWKVPGSQALTGGTGGPAKEAGGTECGPINPRTGLINTLPTQGGSIKQPFLETTEAWQAYDVGVVAYPRSVEKVRLRFAGGGSTDLALRRMPAAIRPSSWEPFRYVSFAVYGCVSEVEGISKAEVVARMHQAGCSA